jgi:copper(I)-binding protein
MRLVIAALISLATASAVELFASRASAHEYGIGDITIEHPIVAPPPRGQTMTAGYMTLINAGSAADRLISASSPAARSVEIHETRAGTGGMMQMQPRPGGVVIPAHGSAVFAPGGLHLMIMGLSQGLDEGDAFPLTLRFEHAGSIDILAMVQRPHAADPRRRGGHMH